MKDQDKKTDALARFQADAAGYAEEILEKIREKLYESVKRNPHTVPYLSIDGVYEDLSGARIGWWTNGFWGGILWQMYHLTGEGQYRAAAEELEEKMDAVLLDSRSMDHDSGFRFLPTAVADYRITKNPASRNRGIVAADNLAGRFNYNGRFIRAWNNFDEENRAGWAIIDCMMNLPLLYWASDEQDDPRYRTIAMMHADTAMEKFIRPDGSSHHILCFDPATGELVKTLGGQGYREGSAWTRGQSWGLYGFTLSFLHTQEKRYLETARKIAGYFVSGIPESGLIPVDFEQPEDSDFEDSTAAAIAACGLIELAKMCGNAGYGDGEKYRTAALRILAALDEKRADYDPARDGILGHCSAQYHAEDHDLHFVYADYYYIEALLKLSNQELFIW